LRLAFQSQCGVEGPACGPYDERLWRVPTHAVFWLEWGSSAGRVLSRFSHFRATHFASHGGRPMLFLRTKSGCPVLLALFARGRALRGRSFVREHRCLARGRCDNRSMKEESIRITVDTPRPLYLQTRKRRRPPEVSRSANFCSLASRVFSCRRRGRVPGECVSRW
jgi:hypothetical protein